MTLSTLTTDWPAVVEYLLKGGAVVAMAYGLLKWLGKRAGAYIRGTMLPPLQEVTTEIRNMNAAVKDVTHAVEDLSTATAENSRLLAEQQTINRANSEAIGELRGELRGRRTGGP